MDAGTGVHNGSIAPPCPLKGWATGAQVSLHNSMMGTFMFCQDGLKTNLMQLFAHAENSEWFSITLSIERNPFSAENQTLRSYRVYISPTK